MTLFDRKPALRWATPLAVVALAGGATGIVATATADDKLPNLTAQQLLVNLQRAEVDTLSGTVVQNSNLGIPDLPGLGSSDDASLSSLVSGSHTLGVWLAGPDKARLQVQGTNDETDVIVNGSDVWTWSYEDNTASHRTLPAQQRQAEKRADRLPAELPKTPQDAAKQALAALEPTTQVSTAGTAKVAGINAYELVLAPKDANSLVTQVRIAVDGTRFIPLRVQVIAGQPKPAFEVAYTQIDFDRPDDSHFTFTPPPGAKVTEVAPKGERSTTKAPSKKEIEARKAEVADKVKVVGQGWSTVVVGKTDAKRSDQSSGQLGQMLSSLPKVSGSWGSGRLLSGTAFSAVVTDDGRVAVGSVKPDLLYKALSK